MDAECDVRVGGVIFMLPWLVVVRDLCDRNYLYVGGVRGGLAPPAWQRMIVER